MSVTVSRARLFGALKELRIRWRRIKDSWDDPASRHFEESVIEPLEPRVRSAVSALEKMGQILIVVRRDCE
ncbi:MAG: hypothetical protein KDA22_14285 [Phycisphaerales bacterium]|nr:hypothetical protein [Phycisphaerales bacterium]